MEKAKRHAYLIMAYDNFYVLEKLLLLLDDDRNDIFLHIDKKTNDFERPYFEDLIKKAGLFFLDREEVFWGDYSQVEVTLDLLSAALGNGRYHYLHLLSGVDLPIKSQDYIHEFFADKACEFLGLVPKTFWYSTRRVKYYFPLINTRHYRKSKFIKGLVAFLVLLQHFLGVNRLKNSEYEIYNGWTWFSITNDFARYLLEKREVIKQTFQNTLAPDELFIHTVAYNSHFKNRIYDITNLKNGSMRDIDWKRGTPYIFRSSDFQELLSSQCLFARKFDANTDKEIIDKIFYCLKSQLELG